MLSTTEIIASLESEWDNSGFLGRLREAKFNENEADDFVFFLHNIRINESDIPCRLVSLLWYLPNFLNWQKERLVNARVINDSQYEKFINQVDSALESILGVP